MAKCSYCGKENPDQAEVCAGCGMALATKPDPQTAPTYSPLARKRIITGTLWLLGGLLVTGVTYSAAKSGGTYVLAWGAIAFGAVQLFQGLLGGRRPPRVENAGYDELEAATHLEAQGRIQDAAAAYKSIAERFASTPAGNDARKSLENLEARLK